MKRILLVTLFFVGTLIASASTIDLATIAKNPSKYVGKKIEFKGMVFSTCPKNDKRLFVSPDNDRSIRLAVILSSGLAADFKGKSVIVKGTLKKSAYVAPKACGRCDGNDCGKSVSEEGSASYFVVASQVK